MMSLPPVSLAILPACCLILGTGAVRADDATDETRLIEDLLALRVMPPDWQEQLERWIKAGWTPPPLPSGKTDDDETIEKLVERWRCTRDPVPAGVKPPTEKVSDRLLEHCTASPGAFAELAWWFDAKRSGVVNRIRHLHEVMPAATEEQLKQKAAVHDWLMTRVGEYPRELLERSRAELENQGDVTRETALFWLMERDWPTAKSFLTEVAEKGSPRARASSLRLLYQHEVPGDPQLAAMRESWRTALRHIVESDADGVTKAKSLEALRSPDWPGQAEWIMTLFKDPALGESGEEYARYQPLASVVAAAPDFWIPRILPFVAGTNRAEHDNAVRCLVQFHLERARLDALRPLLPWLTDPAWASATEDGRLRLIQSMSDVDLPESVPGLLWVVDHDEGFALSGAADALVHYKAKKAVPALKRALSREEDNYHRRSLVAAIIALNGYTAEELAHAMEVYLEESSTQEGRDRIYEFFGGPLPAKSKEVYSSSVANSLLLGRVLEDSRETPEAVLQRVRRRAGELRSTRPDLTTALERWIISTDSEEARKTLVEALQSGRVTAAELQTATAFPAIVLLTALDTGGEWKLAGRTLQSLRSPDTAALTKILQGPDTRAAAMLCALARMKRDALPLAAVETLLQSKDTQCARAAELYLETEDSAQARKVILRRYPGTARIMGAREVYDPGHVTFGEFDSIEEKLRMRVLAVDGPDEVYAVLSSGYWGGAGHCFITVKGDVATLLQDKGGGRLRSRILTAEELKDWKEFTTKYRVDDLAPLNQAIDDGIQYEYVHLTRDGGRRVFMNNPPRSVYVPVAGVFFGGGRRPGPDPGVYGALVDTMSGLVDSGAPMSVHYTFSVPVPGLQLVLPLEEAEVKAIVQHQGGLAVLAKKPGESVAIWHRFPEGKLGADVAETMPVVRPDPNSERGDGFLRSEWLVSAPWRTRVGAAIVQPATRKGDDTEGLWAFEPGREPRLLTKGAYANPVTTPNGRWIVAAKQLGSSWADPNTVVSIDFRTGKETPLSLEPAEEFNVIAWVTPLGRMLIHRADSDSSPFGTPRPANKLWEHRLLDPDTGAMELVTGDFTPLHHESWRPLQSTGSDGFVWAAIPFRDQEKVWTQIGRYDLRTFSFELWLTVPGLDFDSMSMWVDGPRKILYVTVNGDLLSLPLPEKPPAAPAQR